jgi:glycosyltransferase involved in cell wall biosynthesis
MELSVIIPCYNEAENLDSFLPKILEFGTRNNFEIILVNDGSTDGTRSIIEKNLNKGKNLKIINHKLNKGYGGAIKSAIEAADSKYCITIDADGQHNFVDVLKLYNKIIDNDADMIIGSRKGQKDSTLLRRTGKMLIRVVARTMMKISVYDINSGMKIYRTELAKRYLNLCPDGMAYSDIIALVFINNRHLVLEEPIEINPRERGKSTIGIHTAFETFMEILNIITLFSPMKIFLTVSILLFLTGVGWGIRFLIKGLGVSIGSSMLIIISILVFLLGLIAEQLASIRRNIK